MDVAQMLATHSILVKIFLGFLVMGLAIPLLVGKNKKGFKKASLIYTMIFQAIATMIAFAGIVAVFTGDLEWDIFVITMMVIWVAMMVIEIKKYKLIKYANLVHEEVFKNINSTFIKISIIQILLVVIMVVLRILKAKGVISI